jgi:predicted dehydrogenase
MELFKSPSADEKAGRLPWRVDPAVSGGGHFFDLGSHQLDYLDFVFGPIQEVKSLARNYGGFYPAEDFVTAIFTFPGGITGKGTWSFSASPKSSRDTIEIIGDKGTLKFSTFDFVPIVVKNGSGTHEYINERPEHVQYYLIESIVKSLEGKGTPPSTGVSAARTAKIMDEIVSEYYKDKR